MKIYFAGSIRGGRNDRELYLEIITLLKDYGEVLTEHIGNIQISQTGEKKTSAFIHERDMEWLRDSDVVIAEVTMPSLGVGYELGIAENLHKKVLCLYRAMPEKSLSAMVAGNKAFEVIDYSSVKDLKKVFDMYLK